MEDKMYQHCCFLINRLDQQYDKINTKINLYIAINAAFLTLIGFFATDCRHILESCVCTKWMVVASIILLGLILACLIWLAAPYLPKESKFKGDPIEGDLANLATDFRMGIKKSCIYFEDISETSFFTEFGKLFPAVNKTSPDYPDEVKADLMAQIFVLAEGLSIRNKTLRRISYAMIAALLLTTIVITKVVFG